MTQPNPELVHALRELFPKDRDPRLAPRRGDMFAGHGGRVTIDATTSTTVDKNCLVMLRFNNAQQVWWPSRWLEWAKTATVLRRGEDNFDGDLHTAFVESRKAPPAAKPVPAPKEKEKESAKP